MKQSQMHRLALIEGLEARCLMSGSSLTQPLVQSTSPLLAAQTALQAAASKAIQQSAASTATGATQNSTATTQNQTYSKAVMRFLVSHGYLTQAEADRSKAVRRIVDAIVQIKKEAAAGGVSNAVLQAALNLVFQGKIAQAERLIVADSLSLPPEALKTSLNAKQLVRFVADLQIIGAGDKAQDASQWKNVAQKGTDAVLAGDVREVLGLPEAATKGKNARQLLDGAAQINLLGADARSAVAWQGLGLLAQHKISVEKFSQSYASGKDIGQNGQPVQSISSGATGGANIADGAGQATAASGAGGGSTGGAAAVDPMDAAFAGIASNGTDTGQPADAVVVIQNNSDGTYTATVYVIGPDGQPTKSSTETFSDPDGDGTYTGNHGGSGTDPPDGYYPAQATDNGGYVYDPGNSGKSDSTSSSNKNSQSSDNGQNNNANGNNSNSSSSSSTMPSPEIDSSNAAAWMQFLLTNPMGAMELKSMGRSLQLASGGGQDGPLEGAQNPMAGILFGLAPITLSPAVQGANGAVDYANDDWLATSVDPSALREVKLAAGKGVTDPPSDAAGAAGHVVSAPPSHIGTIATGTAAVSVHVSVAVSAAASSVTK